MNNETVIELEKHFDAFVHKDLAKRIDQIDGIQGIEDIISDIAVLPTDSERDFYIGKLSDKVGIGRRAICRDIKKFLAKDKVLIQDKNISIVHPSYEITDRFISLGFKEPVIDEGGNLEYECVRIFCDEKGFSISTANIHRLGGEKLVFDNRERILLTLNDKWNRNKIEDFIKNPHIPQDLYNEIKMAFKQYVELQNEALYGLIAAWVMGTYFHRAFNAYPFLFFYGKKQAGKSRMLDLLERLSFNAIKVKGVSVASMVDSIDGVRSTFLVDQAEVLGNRDNFELSGILADSYTPGGGKRRIVQITNRSRRVVEFESYSPKVFASTRDIDPDIKDRCIEIVMSRASKEYPYPEPYLPIWSNLRDKLYRFLLTRWHDARKVYEFAGQDMTQRVRELWRPIDTILTLENVDDEERLAIKRVFLDSMAETQVGLTELEEKLVEAISELLEKEKEGLFSAGEIIEKMDLPESETFKRKSQEIWAGKALKKLNLFAGRETQKRGLRKYRFTRECLADISKRYGDFNGSMVPAAFTNGLHDTIEKIPMVSYGTPPSSTPLNDAFVPLCTIENKSYGTRQTLDSQGLNHRTIKKNH
jgi:hypothetical protein